MLLALPPEAPTGVVTGGWPFVIAAYSVTAAVLLGYAWSLVSRLNKANREDVES